MAEELKVSDEVKSLVKEIIKKCDLKPISKITYGPGTEVGDGFLSRTHTVDIHDDETKLNLFLKCAINVKIMGNDIAGEIYANEIYFYEVIIPAFMEFLKEKRIEDGFRNVPKCYGCLPKKIIALENLKENGYELCDKDLVGNEQHIEMVFRSYAKFHAISFAYKDQKREEYDKLTAGMMDFLRNIADGFSQQRFAALEADVNDFFKNLDPRMDKFILKNSEYIKSKLFEQAKVGFNVKEDDNSVITQGDCWCNNMMFKYGDNKRYPSDVMLVDWQAIRADTPVLDLSYFFYTAAASFNQTLRKVDDFLEIYHEELSKQIRRMGSDPEILYPLPLFKKEWQAYCRHGFMMAFSMLRVMLGDKKDMPNFENKDLVVLLQETSLFPVNERQDEYTGRLRNLAQHFLLNEFL